MHFSNDVTLFECIFTYNYLVKQLRAAPQSKGINTNTQALKLVYLKNGYIPKYCAVSLHIEKQNAFHMLYFIWIPHKAPNNWVTFVCQNICSCQKWFLYGFFSDECRGNSCGTDTSWACTLIKMLDSIFIFFFKYFTCIHRRKTI